LCSAEKLGPENPYNFESWAVTRLPGFAPNTKQGADGGVDGRATIAHMPDNRKSELALSQVKGGKFSLSALRDFIHVTDREKAAMGCYTTLRPVASRASRIEVVNIGKVSIQNVSYPKMQTWSIAEYFDEKLLKLPIMNDPYLGKSMLPQLF